MVAGLAKGSSATRAAIVCAALAAFTALAGCGSSADPNSASDRAGASDCPTVVLGALGQIARRIYHEGVFSERTASALSLIGRSSALRTAVERGDPATARAAVRALLATGHMTDVKVIRGGQVLADLGSRYALTPLHGEIRNGAGAPIASFLTTVWADSGVIAETSGLAEAKIALRQNGRSIAGSFALPPGELPAQGALAVNGVAYRYTSYPAAVYPTGALRVYLLRPTSTVASLCGPTTQDTIVNTVSRVATLIYQAEAGHRTLRQIKRVQHDRALLLAVASRDREAARVAIDALLNQHIVRLRVNAGGRLLRDVGGPYVLAPVRAPLRLNGRQIGSFVLSIQDDLGYLKLAQRLAGAQVVIQRGSRPVMSSLRPAPANPPASGPLRYGGHSYRAFTLQAQAFPSGPLEITLLIPLPYS